jgi:hypothetical protein
MECVRAGPWWLGGQACRPIICGGWLDGRKHTPPTQMQDGLLPPSSLHTDPSTVALHAILRPAAARITASCRAPCRVALNATTARPTTTATTIGIQNASTTDTTTGTAIHTRLVAATALMKIALPNGATTDTMTAIRNPLAVKDATATPLRQPTQTTLSTRGGAHTRHPLAAPVPASRLPATTRRRIRSSTTWAKRHSLLE